MSTDGASEGLQWLEAHRDTPLAMVWYLGEFQQGPPIPAELWLRPHGEDAWLIDRTGLTRIVDERAIAAARVEDGDRLVITYGKRRLVIEERNNG
jgi:hypothetical protein